MTLPISVLWSALQEVDIGLAADVGTLQRLPKVIGSRRLTAHFIFGLLLNVLDVCENTCDVVFRVTAK